MTDRPLVSVIMPIRNAERFLTRAIQSVLSQSFGDFELLALDDGSTDGSLEMLHVLAERDSRLRVFSRENRGIVATLNELIAKARGLLLARMDSDDISNRERFRSQVEYLSSYPQCVAVGSRALLIDPDGMPICETSNELCHEGIDRSLLVGAGGFAGMCHPSVMMRKTAVENIGGYRDEFTHAEDIDLFLRLAEIGLLANLAHPLYEYRQHHNSVGYAYRELQRRAAKSAVEAAMVRRGVTAIPNASDLPPISHGQSQSHRKWAWWALMAGNVATARKHAFKALKKRPFSIENLRVTACSIRGH